MLPCCCCVGRFACPLPATSWLRVWPDTHEAWPAHSTPVPLMVLRGVCPSPCSEQPAFLTPLPHLSFPVVPLCCRTPSWFSPCSGGQRPRYRCDCRGDSLLPLSSSRAGRSRAGHLLPWFLPCCTLSVACSPAHRVRAIISTRASQQAHMSTWGSALGQRTQHRHTWRSLRFAHPVLCLPCRPTPSPTWPACCSCGLCCPRLVGECMFYYVWFCIGRVKRS